MTPFHLVLLIVGAALFWLHPDASLALATAYFAGILWRLTS